VVSDPDITADQRFPLLAVVPVTGTAGVGALYPELSPGPSGFTRASCALIDHARQASKLIGRTRTFPRNSSISNDVGKGYADCHTRCRKQKQQYIEWREQTSELSASFKCGCCIDVLDQRR
jgi:hypothetical protein